MNRFFLTITTVSALTVTGYALQLAAFPVALSANGTPAELAGVIVAAYTVGIVIYRIMSLKWIDRFPWRPQVIIGAGLAALSALVMATWPATPIMVAARALYGIGFAAVTTAAMAAIGQRAEPDRRGALLGVYSAALIAPMILGPALGLILLRSFGFPVLALASAALPLVAALATLAAPGDRPAPAADLPFRPDLPVFALGVAVAMCAVPVGALEATLPYAVEGSAGLGLLPVYFALGIGIVAGRFAGGYVAARIGWALTSFIGLLVGAGGLLLTAVIPLSPVFSLISGIGALGVGLATSSLTARVSAIVPREAQGRLLAGLGITYNIAFAGAAAVGAQTLTIARQGPFYFSTAALALAAVLAAVVIGRLRTEANSLA